MTLKTSSISRRTALKFMAAGALATTALPAWAQTDYPSRPIRLVVTLPAGTSADSMARFIAEQLSRELGQPVVVDNRPGASSTIGARAVAESAADGYTLLYGLAPSISLNPHLFKDLPYKASDFAPIIHLLDVPFVLVVRSDSPYQTVDDLFEAARARPDGLKYPSYGVGSPNHVAMLQILQAKGASMTHVPYPDGGLSDLLGGRLDCSLDVTAMAMPHVTSGVLRPLVASARERLAVLPDVATLQEAGLGEPLYSWNGLFARAGTPPEVIERLAAAMQDITSRAEFREKVENFTQVPRGGTPEEFAAFLEQDSENWGRIIAAADITLD